MSSSPSLPGASALRESSEATSTSTSTATASSAGVRQRTNEAIRMKSRSSNDDFLPEQFIAPPPKFPLKSILLATFLFTVGSIMLILGALMTAGIIPADERLSPLLFIGTILWIPGAYHVRIAYLAFRGYPGYDYSMIPDYD